MYRLEIDEHDAGQSYRPHGRRAKSRRLSVLGFFGGNRQTGLTEWETRFTVFYL